MLEIVFFLRNKRDGKWLFYNQGQYVEKDVDKIEKYYQEDYLVGKNTTFYKNGNIKEQYYKIIETDEINENHDYLKSILDGRVVLYDKDKSIIIEDNM